MSRSRPLAAAGAALAIALWLAGCRSQPMITPAPIYSRIGAELNRAAVLRGLAVHRWQVVDEAPGRITARFDKKRVGKYVATVDVVYDDETIELRYRDSQGLLCLEADGGCATIHRAYNRWVVQLAKDLEYAAHDVRLESQRSRPLGFD